MLYAKTLEYRTSREQFVYIFSRLAQAYIWTKTMAFYFLPILYFKKVFGGGRIFCLAICGDDLVPFS